VTGSQMAVRQDAAKRIAQEVRAFGGRSLETGGFLLAPRSTGILSVAALAGDAGIVRHADLFQISARALDCLFHFADDHDLYVPVQFHSHRRWPFLSQADEEHGLRAEGFVSTVVPGYTAPSCSVNDWGWWSFEAGRWTAVTAPTAIAGEITVLEFDGEGIRAR
jgi:hypothetical protein